jgi:hypothetical protein
MSADKNKSVAMRSTRPEIHETASVCEGRRRKIRPAAAETLDERAGSWPPPHQPPREDEDEVRIYGVERDVRQVVAERVGPPQLTVHDITQDKERTEEAAVLQPPGGREVASQDSTYQLEVVREEKRVENGGVGD